MPHKFERGYIALIGYIQIIRAAVEAAAVVGVEKEVRFNFGRSANYPRPWPRVMEKL